MAADPVTSPDAPEPTTLPCGCFINPVYENGVPTLKISPCHPLCPNLRDALGLATEQDKPIEYRRAP